MRSDPVHAPTPVETRQAHPGADTGLDHMGRRKAKSLGDAIRMDWPWILALVVLLAFILSAMSGRFHL